MLSPQEQQALQQIELDLNSSDPDLAEELQTFTPCTGDRAFGCSTSSLGWRVLTADACCFWRPRYPC